MNAASMYMRRISFIFISLCMSACVSSGALQMDADKREKLAYIHYQLGIDAIGRTGKLPKAFDELMESNRILANQPDVLDALAYAWLLRGDLEKSERYYIKALRHGGSAKTHNNYANLLNRLERFKEAEKSARKALNDPRYPNQDLAFINLGSALLGQQQFFTASQAFQQAKAFNPSNLIADLRLADTYVQQHKLREASLLFEMLIAKQPFNRSAVEGLISIYKQQHNKSKTYHVLKTFSQHTSSPLDKAWALNAIDRLDGHD